MVNPGKARGPIRAVAAAAAVAAVVGGVQLAPERVDLGGDLPAVASADSAAAVSTTLTCPGPDRPGTEGFRSAAQTVTQRTAIAPAELVTDADAGELTARSLPAGKLAVQPVTTRDGGAPHPLKQPAALVLQGTGGLGLGVSAAQWAIDDEDTVSGLAATSCTPVVQDGWLPLGGNQDGRVVRLVLANPSRSAVTVDAKAYGRDGVIDGLGVDGEVVPAGDRKVITLGSFDEKSAEAMLHVTSSGGVSVTAVDTLQVGERRAGQAMARPVQPGKDLVLPAFAVHDRKPHLRVAVPGGQDATVRVRIMNFLGEVVADEVSTAPGGGSGAVKLPSMPSGVYSARVSADVPVVAASLGRTGTSGDTDLSWALPSVATTSLTGGPVPSLPSGATARLVLFGTGGARADVVTTGEGGGTTTHQVPDDRPTPIDVTGKDAVWVKVRSGKVFAALELGGTAEKQTLGEIVPLGPVTDQPQVRSVTGAG